jgi:lysophospholipid acyltransferase (LPLAT)-like uncharacterized protein
MKNKQNNFVRKIKENIVFQTVAAFIASLLVRLVYLTNRVEIRNVKTIREYRRKPAIIAFWHGRSLMLLPASQKIGLLGNSVVSIHRDGRLIAKLQGFFKIKQILGSSSAGGANALKVGIKVLRKNEQVFIAPDGPRGPLLRLKDGLMFFAKMTGAPIIPICYSCSKAWFIKSWDRYLIPKFFGKIIVDIGTPIYIDRKISNEEFEIKRREIEDVMIKQLQKLDAEFKHKRIEPK